jgi:hypothetical protein
MHTRAVLAPAAGRMFIGPATKIQRNGQIQQAQLLFVEVYSYNFSYNRLKYLPVEGLIFL